MSLLAFLLNQKNGVVLSDEMDMDWKETPDAHIFEIDIPGATKEDVKVELVHENRILQITADRKEEEEEEEEKGGGGGNKWHCRERARGGRLMRQFRLPDNAKVDEIKASMGEGVLTITVPINKDQLKKKHKSVEINLDGDDDHDDDHDHGHAPKGLGRFVCCKA